MIFLGTRRQGNREWRRLHNYEINGLYGIPMIIYRRLVLERHVVRMKEDRSYFNILKAKSTVYRPRQSPRRRWEDNIRTDFK
jgi:hypothetical protein